MESARVRKSKELCRIKTCVSVPLEVLGGVIENPLDWIFITLKRNKICFKNYQKIHEEKILIIQKKVR